jgi:hypothetical protein
MNQSLKKFLSIALLISASVINAACCDTDCSTSCDTAGSCPTTACYPNRSQGFYKVRQVAGMVGHTQDIQNDMDSWWGMFSITPGYHQTFRSKQIAECLFDGDLTCQSGCEGTTIQVQGRNVANRTATAWLADYFYLPSDFDSTLRFSPKIKNFILDLDFYLGLDEWWKGAYLRLHGPIVSTRWSLGFCENVINSGTADDPAGYFTTGTLARSALLADFSAYAAGGAPTDPAAAPNTVTFDPLKYARIAGCSSKETGFAELRMELGWNFWTDEDYHLGVALYAAAPTGNMCKPCFLFDAVVGNGKHWELGGVVTGHYVFWRSEDAEKHFGGYVDATIAHQFKRSGLRTFDLTGRPNSKYALAAKFGPNNNNLSNAAGAIVASKQFAYEYAPVANISTVNVSVSSSVVADVVAWFNFTSGGFSWDLGYNFYGRSCEDIDCSTDCDPCAVNDDIINSPNTWALKGDARMFGYAAVTAGGLTAGQAVALSATQNKATIHAGTEAAVGVPLTPSSHVNANADNATLAFAGTTNQALFVTAASATQINTSIQPVFLGRGDINFAGTRSISNSVWTNLSYNFEGGDRWKPFLGVGALAEFGQNSDCCGNDCNDDCGNDCMTCTPSYWGVWVKGGVSFD